MSSRGTQPWGDQEKKVILGICFFNGTADRAVELARQGGLVVCPSAPVLLAMTEDAETRQALLESRLALTDSGFMVLLWNLWQSDTVRRLSGLEYLKRLLDEPEMARPEASFWIMPNEEVLSKSRAWLRQKGHPVPDSNFYLAPIYPAGSIADEELLHRLREAKPKHVFLAIGGGTQERLGAYLQRQLPPETSIHCIGAAIAFLSGAQVNIPTWADQARLGWLLRCLSAPHIFIPRYLRALRLVPVLWRYRERLPELTVKG